MKISIAKKIYYENLKKGKRIITMGGLFKIKVKLKSSCTYTITYHQVRISYFFN